jgi:hypothetical protein
MEQQVQYNDELTAGFLSSGLVRPTAKTFTFRTVTDPKTQTQVKRAPVTLSKLPLITPGGLEYILQEDSKGLEYLLEVVHQVQIAAARELIEEISDASDETFDYSKVLWSSLTADAAKSGRSSGVTKELLDEFEQDYIAVMPEATGITVEQAKKGAAALKGKFNHPQVRANKELIARLLQRLAEYAQHTTKEHLAVVIEYLHKKGNELLAVTVEDVADSLGI